MNKYDIIALFILKQIKGIGVSRLNYVLSQCKPSDIFEKNQNELSCLLKVKDISILKQVHNKSLLLNAEKEFELMKQHSISFITVRDKNYPFLLKQLNDPPPFLFYKGTLPASTSRFISVVGTRKPSADAQRIVYRLIDTLKPVDPVIVSGLALGIDTIAHKVSIDHQVPTIGVLGSGFGCFYPRSNERLAQRILDKDGIIFTEHFFLDPPNREHFPKRNRIVAGLSSCTVVVQSASSGGSLLTADLANGYNRDVFAFPGSLDESVYRGTHKLIKENKAALVESGEDIIKAMNWEVQSPEKFPKSIFLDLSNLELQIVKLLSQHNKLHIDQLQRSLYQVGNNLNIILLGLEMKNIIKTLPGKHFSLLQ